MLKSRTLWFVLGGASTVAFCFGLQALFPDQMRKEHERQANNLS